MASSHLFYTITLFMLISSVIIPILQNTEGVNDVEGIVNDVVDNGSNALGFGESVFRMFTIGYPEIPLFFNLFFWAVRITFYFLLIELVWL